MKFLSLALILIPSLAQAAGTFRCALTYFEMIPTERVEFRIKDKFQCAELDLWEVKFEDRVTIDRIKKLNSVKDERLGVEDSFIHCDPQKRAGYVTYYHQYRHTKRPWNLTVSGIPMRQQYSIATKDGTGFRENQEFTLGHTYYPEKHAKAAWFHGYVERAQAPRLRSESLLRKDASDFEISLGWEDGDHKTDRLVLRCKQI